MASKSILVAMAIVVAVVAPVMAKDFMVGDENGWKLNFDYKTWAEGKEFHVGDRLMFMYKAGSHNVIKSNQTEFQQCLKSLTSAPLTSGNDIIPLATTGKKWYICGVSDHCAKGGMKLVINVLPEVATPAPSPVPGGNPGSPPSSVPGGSPGSAATGIAPSNFFSWMIAALVISLMIKA